MDRPEISTMLRRHLIRVPDVIKSESTGITINGKTIHSLIFTTDITIIANTNADAVIAVYPFTPSPAITQAILSVSDIPVLCGAGGGLTSGVRSADIAMHAEFQGALAVVVNAPTTVDTIRAIRKKVDIPIVYTVASPDAGIFERLEAGVDLLNISCGPDTAEAVRLIRGRYPDIPIIATGGKSDESILATINAGANAITYTPPQTSEILRTIMEKYRSGEVI